MQFCLSEKHSLIFPDIARVYVSLAQSSEWKKKTNNGSQYKTGPLESVIVKQEAFRNKV